jgi:hypothetical protein
MTLNNYRPVFTEDTYDEINAELRELNARALAETEEDSSEAQSNSIGQGGKLLVGSGEDFTYVLFGSNYKPLYSGAN